MDTQDLFDALAKLAGGVFVVSSMLAMGLSLTVGQILTSLKAPVRVILALAVNFALVPLLAYGLARGFSLDQPLETGVILLGCAAGAPFIPKLTVAAKGDIAWGVGLMVMLMVVTIAYLPLVLPRLVSGVSVDAWDIAKSLIVIMLIPLALGLLAKANWPDDAAHWQPVMAKTSSLSILVLLVLGLGLNVSNILSLIGTSGIVAILILTIGGMVLGWLLGGRDPAQRNVLALGTAFRNFSAAVVVASQNFSGTQSLSLVLVGGVIFMLVTLPAARVIGRRAAAAAPSPGFGGAPTS